jgi:glutamine synthetase
MGPTGQTLLRPEVTAAPGGYLHALHQALAACGLDVQQIDHEDAHGQYEVNFAHGEALLSCDRLMLFKLAAHALAEARGMVFSMMPKPFANQPGSGLHFHVSLWQGGSSVFDAAPTAPARSAPWVASSWPACWPMRRRCVRWPRPRSTPTSGSRSANRSVAPPGHPAYVAHGPNNRTALVRTLPGRFEWRLPDASANPYLATAGLIAAGLDGIDRQLDPGPDCVDDLFELSLAQIRARGMAVLPQSLNAALDALEGDSVITAALGETLTTELLRVQRAEWAAYARHVSGWELERYARASHNRQPMTWCSWDGHLLDATARLCCLLKGTRPGCCGPLDAGHHDHPAAHSR